VVVEVDPLMGMVPWDFAPHEDEVVRFLRVGAARMAEPFYDQTLNAILQGPTAVTEVSFSDLRSLIGDQRPAPRAVVLHTGRCGSTLLMRMLLHDRATMGASEPLIVNALHWRALRQPAIAARNRQVMADLLVVLDRFAATRGQRTVLKLTSWEAVDAGRVAEICADAPVIFVHRSVQDVVASDVAQPPAWGENLDVSTLAAWVPRVAALPEGASMAEVYAAMWAAEAEAALALEPGRVLFVGYTDLVDRTEDVLGRVAEHIGADRWRRSGAVSELRYYAKALNPSVAFDPDGEHARPALSGEVAERVDDVVRDLPARLAAR
jgi:hypothetical protein